MNNILYRASSSDGTGDKTISTLIILAVELK
jgi:hypothetical protein